MQGDGVAGRHVPRHAFITDAAVTVAATTVKAGANVVGATVDVARAGIRAVTPNDDTKK